MDFLDCEHCEESECLCGDEDPVCDFCWSLATESVEDYDVCLDHRFDAIEIVRKRSHQL